MATAAPTGKVDICHKPGKHNQRILSINLEKDGEKHFGHGDHLKTDAICEDDIADNNCDGMVDNQAENNYNCVIQTGNEDATCDSGTCVEPPQGCPCWDEDILLRISTYHTYCAVSTVWAAMFDTDYYAETGQFYCTARWLNDSGASESQSHQIDASQFEFCRQDIADECPNN